MTLATILFIAITLLYIGQCWLLVYGVSKSRYNKNVHFEPTVSIVIAARNEEKNIGACLQSLAHLEYPTAKLEIIVVNDNSTDSTVDIIRDYVITHPSIKTLTARQGTDRLRGKANAIAQGIDVSSGEIILMTDADCMVPQSWVRTTVQNYSDDIGVVAGLTLLHPTGWFAGMQSLDWAYILALASAAMALNYPLSCIGNNFSFRRKAYDEVGGYRGIQFSVTEDFALFKAMTLSRRWGYRYPLEKEALVFSNACATILELYRQKRRWGVGGKDMPLSAITLMVVAFLMHLFLLSFLFFAISPSVLFVGLILKFGSDFAVLFMPLHRTGQARQLKYFLIFELYYIVYVVLLPFAVFLGGRVVWKGRKY